MKRCPKCNARYGDGATYCEHCGAKLVKPVICPMCGAEVDEDAAFCPKCGHSMNEAAPIVESNHTDGVTIEKYKQEIALYQNRKNSMMIIGSILLAVGLALFITFLILFYKSVDLSGDQFLAKATLYMLLMVLGVLMLYAGAALMIVAGAVFGRKIANRQRIINESENR